MVPASGIPNNPESQLFGICCIPFLFSCYAMQKMWIVLRNDVSLQIAGGMLILQFNSSANFNL